MSRVCHPDLERIERIERIERDLEPLESNLEPTKRNPKLQIAVLSGEIS